jgi:DHA1 family tetracycline resistance protein-like MFS transporter
MEIRQRVSPFFILLITIFIDVTGFGIVLPLLPYYASTFGVGSTALGVLVASFSLMQFISSPILGRLSDKIGRRPILLLSILTSVASFIFFALANSFWMLLISRIVAGLATEISVAQAYIADITEERERAKGMGRVGAIHGAGFIVGPALGGFLSTYGFSAAGWVAALLAMVNLIFVFFFLPESMDPNQKVESLKSHPGLLASLKSVLSRPHMGSIIVILFIMSFAFSAFPVIMPILAMVFFGLSSVEMSFFFVYMGLVQIFFQGIIVGKIASRIAEQKIIAIGLMIMTGGVFLLVFFPILTMFIVLTTITFIGIGLLNTSIPSYVSKITPITDRGRTMGVTQSVSSIARVPGPLIAGIVLEYKGVLAPFFLSGVLLIIATFFGIRIASHKNEK